VCCSLPEISWKFSHKFSAPREGSQSKASAKKRLMHFEHLWTHPLTRLFDVLCHFNLNKHAVCGLSKTLPTRPVATVRSWCANRCTRAFVLLSTLSGRPPLLWWQQPFRTEIADCFHGPSGILLVGPYLVEHSSSLATALITDTRAVQVFAQGVIVCVIVTARALVTVLCSDSSLLFVRFEVSVYYYYF